MDDVFRFLVREDLVRAVIGKGGEHIKIIKEEAKASGIDTKVSIYAQGSNGSPLMEGSVDRVMSIQSTMDGLGMALTSLLPSLQIHQNHKLAQNKRGGFNNGQRSQKLEIRLIVPAHCCSAIIGKGGSVIKGIKEETSSYIQVYTLALPQSEEHCVRIQNFEASDLVTTAVRVFEAIAEIKGKNPITMYDPIFFEHGEYGDTGSYVDTEWYQEALRAGIAKPTPFKEVKATQQHAPPPDHSYDHGYHGYEGGYEEAGYEGYGYEDPYAATGYEDPYATGYDAGYGAGGYGEDPYGYGAEYDESYGYYAPPPPARRPRARAAPRSRGPPSGYTRPPPRGYSRGYPPTRGARGAPPAPRGGSYPPRPPTSRGRGGRGARRPSRGGPAPQGYQGGQSQHHHSAQQSYHEQPEAEAEEFKSEQV